MISQRFNMMNSTKPMVHLWKERERDKSINYIFLQPYPSHYFEHVRYYSWIAKGLFPFFQHVDLKTREIGQKSQIKCFFFASFPWSRNSYLHCTKLKGFFIHISMHRAVKKKSFPTMHDSNEQHKIRKFKQI